MNLYVRLLWLLWKLRSMAKLSDPLSIANLTLRVWPNDLDLNFHMNNGRYLTIMDLGRIQLMALNGILWPSLKRRWLPAVGSIKIHFIKALKLFDKFTLTTQIIYWDEKWIYIEQKIFKDEELCAVALIKGLLTSKTEGKISPAQVLELLENKPTQPPMPSAVAHWQAAEKASRDG